MPVWKRWREKLALLVTAMMLAGPASASDFSGFFTLFFGAPFVALIILLLCILLCDKRMQNVRFRVAGILMLMVGTVPLMRWLWIFPWPFLAVPLALIASVVYVLGVPFSRRWKARKGLAWLLFSMASLVLLMAIAEMLLIVSKGGKHGAFAVIAIAIALFGPIILIFRSVVRDT